MERARRRPFIFPAALAIVTLALLAWALVRLHRQEDTPAVTAAVTTPPDAGAAPVSSAEGEYRVLLREVNPLIDERKFTQARGLLSAFSAGHPGTRSAELAARNVEALARMEKDAREQDRRETVAELQADITLLEASGRFDDALAELDAVPAEQRDEAWRERRALTVQRAEAASRAAASERPPEPAKPAVPPEHGELSEMARLAEDLLKRGERDRARAEAKRLQERLAELEVPCLDEEFAPRAQSVLEQVALAEIATVLPDGRPSDDLSRMTRPERTRVLTQRRDALVRFLESLPRLADLRKELKRRLNAARREAHAAIFDHKLYPDEGHGVEGQPKVDERVHAVERIWKQPLTAAGEFDSTVAAALAAIREADDLLGNGGASKPSTKGAPLSGVEEKLSVRGFALDEREQALLDENERVRGFNEKVTTSMTRDERRVLGLLNDYREMLGLRILEIEEHLVLAARWHSNDMKLHDYFDHFDNEGRGPFDRAMEMHYSRAAVGENIAGGVEEPAGVHWGFFCSSGHHRNMLMRLWTHVGIGRSGSIWTEDFGAGLPQAH